MQRLRHTGWLLAQHVFPCIDGLDSHIGMHMGRGGHGHQVHVLAHEQAVDVGRGERDAQLGRQQVRLPDMYEGGPQNESIPNC